MLFSTDYSTPIGDILIVSDGEAICGIWFYGQKHFLSSLSEEIVRRDDLAIFEKVKNWFDDYFNGLNPKIDFKIRPNGTDFRCRVWKMLLEIPYGETATYGEIASKLSDTMSPQAVGSAVGHNPVSILIPCHRVIGADGRLTGYAGGINRKMALLKLEKSYTG